MTGCWTPASGLWTEPQPPAHVSDLGGLKQQQLRGLIRRQGPLEVESLQFVAGVPAQELGLNEIGRVSLAFDRPMIFGDYRDNRDLGGFILIDRITNETVAFGLIDLATVIEDLPAPPEETKAPAPVLPKLLQQWRSRLVPGLFSGASVGLGAILLGAAPQTGLLLGVADAVFRPLARSLYTDYRRGASHRAAARRTVEREQALRDGDGI